jgi:hypothetical protein
VFGRCEATTGIAPFERLRKAHFFAGWAILLSTFFICCEQQISEWGMLAGQAHAFS